MAQYTVRAGDCISSIATRHGMAWDEIWNHADNDAIRELRASPNLLCEGDTLVLPDLAPKYESLATGQEHSLVLNNTLVVLRVKLVRNGEPLSGAYTLEAFERTYEGSLSDGVLEEHIPARAREARLVLHETNEAIALELGHLDPANTPRGAVDRLRNLGLLPARGRNSSDLDGTLRYMLRLIQRADGLTESGELDAATADALVSRYGC